MPTMIREQPVKTKGERFLEKIESLRAQISALTETAFSEDDITGYIATLGIVVERFLGDAVFPDFYETYAGSRFFYDALNKLHPEARLPQSQVNALHRLRRKYNEQKHRPGTQVSLSELITICTDAQAALETVVASGIGTLGDKVFQAASTFWIGGTDYIHQGITEVFVYLPLESEKVFLPPPLLTFFVKIDGWSDLVDVLGKAGDVCGADEILPQKAVSKLVHGDDPVSPRVYVGPLKPLLAALNRIRADLVEDKNYNVHGFVHRLAPFTTLLLTLEYLRERQSEQSLSVDDVVSYVNAALTATGFCVDSAGKQLVDDARFVVSLLSQLPSAAWRHLSGPAWLDSESFSRLAGIRNIRSSDHLVAISPDLRVILDAGRT